jgi:hypothetical protein
MSFKQAFNLYCATWAFHCCTLPMIMKWWKKISWFYGNEVPFEWKYLMVLHAICIEIQFKYIEWNSNSIEAKLNWRKIGCKLVHKVLKICLWFPLSMVLKKTNSKRHIYEKTFSIPFKINSKPKPILVKWNNYWNLNFSTLYQLWCYLLSLEFFMFIGGVGCWEIIDILCWMQ